MTVNNRNDSLLAQNMGTVACKQRVSKCTKLGKSQLQLYVYCMTNSCKYLRSCYTTRKKRGILCLENDVKLN